MVGVGGVGKDPVGSGQRLSAMTLIGGGPDDRPGISPQRRVCNGPT